MNTVTIMKAKFDIILIIQKANNKKKRGQCSIYTITMFADKQKKLAPDPLIQKLERLLDPLDTLERNRI